MTTRTGIMDLTGSGKDLSELYELRTSGPTGTTHYVSQIYGQDLGSIFVMNANLGGLGLVGTTGTNCGHKLLNGTDLGSLFCVKGSVIPLVFYYPFNGDFLNYATGTGVNIGSVLSQTTISSTNYKFGSGSLVVNPIYNIGFNATTTPITNNNGYTFSLWVKMTTLYNNNMIFSFQKGTSASANRICLFFWNGSNNLYCNSNIGAFYSGVRVPNILNSATSFFTPTVNEWFHFAWTLDKNSNSAIYINGQPVLTATYTAGAPNAYINPTFDICRISGDPSLNVSGVNGFLDEFYYYDGILNSTQISNLYSRNSVL